MNKINVSIVIVNYNSKADLFICLNSIYTTKQKVRFEVIVVDNSERNNLDKELRKKFSKVKYVKSEKNLGYARGNNLGAKHSLGKYLFILNPDTKIFNGTLDYLHGYLNKNKKTGIVSPVFLDEKLNFFKVQGTKELSPLNIIFSQSFIRKLFPKKNILNELRFNTWNRKFPREVKAVPGAALMISKELFNKVKGFDDNLFLYFEENDISNRIRSLGYKLYIVPKAKIIHKIAGSTKNVKNVESIYKKSRFLYVKKYYGIVNALFVETLLLINKFSLSIFFILMVALVLRLINLSQSMIFIGDQGWFYLSARDMLTEGKIPLVGITSSHTWLHQGPLWTYMLSVALSIFNFNPLSGAYLTAFIGTLAVFLIYRLGSVIFSRNVGIIAALLYATSPLIVYSDRIPFDPSPIPFFTVLYFYSLYKWIKGNIIFFPLALFLIAILYNLELASFTLFSILVLFLILGFWKNKSFVKKLKNKKTVLYSSVAVLFPMFPILLYDLSNGFKQTVVFFGWTIYKPLSFLFNHSTQGSTNGFIQVYNFALLSLQKIIFVQSLLFSILIFISSIIFLLVSLSKLKEKMFSAKFLLFLILVTTILGILVNQTPSDAYLPIIFPFVIFSAALLFDFLFSLKYIKLFAFAILLFIIFTNLQASIVNSKSNRFLQRMQAVDKIIKLSEGKRYNLIGKGLNSQFETFTMNYQYLLWWKGHEPSKSKENLKIIISEQEKNITVKKNKN